MFYSQFILAKKGPLGTIWIAAHLERKLRKNQVADTDIGFSVDSIISPDVPIALRLSSHLLVGVVRIYNRKVNYLFDDCSETLLKVKQAFRSTTAVDLPPEESKAPYHSITLPETFDLDDFELPDNDILHRNYNDHHISSREQITLQDNMEGVSYSTSKFGLDERFGDGDALDLDEELLLEKIVTGGNVSESGDPQASTSTTIKQDDKNEEMPVYSETMVVDPEDNDLMDCTEGPCTPGLLEEPNISNVKEASACDDHLESEYHLESTLKENSKDISSKDIQEEDHPSSRDDTTLDAITHENACPSVLLETTEPLPQVECTSVSESDKVEAVNNGLLLADVIKDTSINKDIASSLSVNHNQGSDELCLEKCPDVSGVSEKDPSAPELLGSIGMTSSGQKLAPDISDNQSGDFTGNHETEAVDKNFECGKLNFDVSDKDETNGIPTLRACTAILEQSDDPSKSPCSVPVDAEPDNAALATSEIEDRVNLGKEDGGEQSRVQESVSVEAHNFDSGQVNSICTQNEPVGIVNNCVETELPAPEKLLSVPEGHANLHENMLDEFSPSVLVGHNEGDAGSKTLTGKKRTFTESTLTEQSLNSVESSRQVRGKRTIEPDDDDLLSSILVGRKSSIFRVKPTPRLSEVTSMKRTGSTTRSAAPKRKLLMDDTMALHGDMIRQQLTSTEDIRRLRKKAPCTYAEISLIKKQHLEDQSFLEALLTGMSVELTSLQSQEYDLSRISVCQNKETGSSLENTSDPILASLETTGEIKLAYNDDINGASIETDPHVTSPINENRPDLVSQRDGDPGNTNETEQDQLLVKISEMSEPSENPLASDNRLEEVVCIGTEVDIGREHIKDPVISQQEILLDASGAESSSNHDDANPNVVPVAESLEPVRNETDELNENGESICFVNVDAPAAEMDSAEVDDGQATGRDEVTEKDGSNVEECEILLGEREFMMSEMERDGDFGPVPDAKNDELEHDVLTDVHNVASEDHNTLVSDLGDGSLGYGANATLTEAFQSDMIDEEISGFGLHERDDMNYSATGFDTEFLNVDDEDLTEVADDYEPDAEEAHITENSGWSSRTRAVSKYLQTAFIKEAGCGRKSLSIDNLLTGKSRKEASRMFFETLVLTTRDYVHVEQWHPFDDITIKPRTKLMKSDF